MEPSPSGRMVMGATVLCAALDRARSLKVPRVALKLARAAKKRTPTTRRHASQHRSRFHKMRSRTLACRRKAKMSALSKVKLSVSCPLGSRDGGGRSDERGADEQTRTQPDRCSGPP